MSVGNRTITKILLKSSIKIGDAKFKFMGKTPVYYCKRYLGAKKELDNIIWMKAFGGNEYKLVGPVPIQTCPKEIDEISIKGLKLYNGFTEFVDNEGYPI
jgi:hypothetical protein